MEWGGGGGGGGKGGYIGREKETHSKSMNSLAVRTERVWPRARREIGFNLSSKSRPRRGDMLPILGMGEGRVWVGRRCGEV